jgi:hypothetical protein
VGSGGSYGNFTSGSNYAAGSSVNQLRSSAVYSDGSNVGIFDTANLSGTWKWMGANGDRISHTAVGCRVS